MSVDSLLNFFLETISAPPKVSSDHASLLHDRLLQQASMDMGSSLFGVLNPISIMPFDHSLYHRGCGKLKCCVVSLPLCPFAAALWNLPLLQHGHTHIFNHRSFPVLLVSLSLLFTPIYQSTNLSRTQ